MHLWITYIFNCKLSGKGWLQRVMYTAYRFPRLLTVSVLMTPNLTNGSPGVDL